MATISVNSTADTSSSKGRFYVLAGGAIFCIGLWIALAFLCKRATLADPSTPKSPKLEQLEKAISKRSLEKWWIDFKHTHEHNLSGDIESQFVCAICLDAVLSSEIVYNLPCNHIFHDKCLGEWFLNKHSTCPLCHSVFYQESRTVPKLTILRPPPVHLRDSSDAV